MTETPRLVVGPFNRVEGDLEIRLAIEDGRVAQAYANSPMFRGFEMMMVGKSPMDALTVTPRISSTYGPMASAKRSRICR